MGNMGFFDGMGRATRGTPWARRGGGPLIATRPPWLRQKGLGASFQSELAKAVVGTVGTVKKGVPAPMDLYNEAAPRVQRILKQYDDAAPGIDFATQNWWLVVVGSFVLGVAAGYTAQALYNKVHKRG